MHLVFNFPEGESGVGRTLCGQPATISENSSTNEFEITAAMTFYEIFKAAAKDDKNKICNKCLAEFFDKVLPLKWQMKKKGSRRSKKRRPTRAARKKGGRRRDKGRSGGGSRTLGIEKDD